MSAFVGCDNKNASRILVAVEIKARGYGIDEGAKDLTYWYEKLEEECDAWKN